MPSGAGFDGDTPFLFELAYTSSSFIADNILKLCSIYYIGK